MTKESKKYELKLIIFSLFFSFVLVIIAVLFKSKFFYKEKKIILNSTTQQFSSESLKNYYINLTKKYYFLEKVDNIENYKNLNLSNCEKINITKERILCKEYIKQKIREVNIYKPYLLFALVKYGGVDAETIIKKYNISRELLAQGTLDVSICLGDKECIKKYEEFKKESSIEQIEKFVLKAWILYEQGLLTLDNFVNPYNKTFE